MKYIEFQQQTAFYSINGLKENLKHYNDAIQRWAYIVHDKDKDEKGEPKAPHFHVMIEFKSKSYDLDRVAKMFKTDKEHLQKPKLDSRKRSGETIYGNMLSYLIHNTEGSREKYQYDPAEVVANFDYLATIQGIQTKVQAIKTHKDEVLELIGRYANNEISHKKLSQALTWDDFRQYNKDIEKATKWRSIKAKSEEDNDMKVIYICGEAGSGKTTLAKYFADTLGFDYFISGSGADPLDGYDNEECIILDDLRADVFKKSELFKLLDNNTRSGVKSRYYNKMINHCRMIIITSVKEPESLYKWELEEIEEPVAQFVRRLGHSYLRIDGDLVMEVALNKEGHRNGAKPQLNMDVVWAYYKIIEKSDTSIGSLMKAISKRTREELEKGLTDKGEDLPF